MKNCFLIILMALASFFCSPCAAQRIFTDIPSGMGIEKVYFSKAAINMVQNSLITRSTSSVMSIRDKIKNIEEIEIVNCDNAANLVPVKSLIMNAISKLQVEPVIEMEDDDERKVIYVSSKRNDKNEADLVVILNYDRTEISVVAIRGTISLNN